MINSIPRIPAVLETDDTLSLVTSVEPSYNLPVGTTIGYIRAEIPMSPGVVFEFPAKIDNVGSTSFEASCSKNISGPGEVRLGRIISSYGTTTFTCYVGGAIIKEIYLELGSHPT